MYCQGADPEVLVQDRLTKGKQRLDQAIEQLALLCEPVVPPKGELEHIHYFCGNVEIPSDLKEREPQRSALYQGTASLVRAYASIVDELEAAGYTSKDITRIQKLQKHYLDLREIIKQASGESLDVRYCPDSKARSCSATSGSAICRSFFSSALGA